MTAEEVEKVVIDFAKDFIERRLLGQLDQVVPGAEAPALREALRGLYAPALADAVEALRHMAAPQEWLALALYGAGLTDADPDEMREACQGLAEWLFGIPGHYRYGIPDQWSDAPMGALWWRAMIRAEGDELITIREAAALLVVRSQAITARIDRGTLRGFTDPEAGARQGRRLVRRRDVLALKEG